MEESHLSFIHRPKLGKSVHLVQLYVQNIRSNSDSLQSKSMRPL